MYRFNLKELLSPSTLIAMVLCLPFIALAWLFSQASSQHETQNTAMYIANGAQARHHENLFTR